MKNKQLPISSFNMTAMFYSISSNEALNIEELSILDEAQTIYYHHKSFQLEISYLLVPSVTWSITIKIWFSNLNVNRKVFSSRMCNWFDGSFSTHLLSNIPWRTLPQFRSLARSNLGWMGWGHDKWTERSASAFCWKRSSWSSREIRPRRMDLMWDPGCRSRCRTPAGWSPRSGSPRASREPFHS